MADQSLLHQSKRAHAILMSVGTFLPMRAEARDTIHRCADSLAAAIRAEEASRIPVQPTENIVT